MWDVYWSPGDERIFAIGGDGTYRVFEAATGLELLVYDLGGWPDWSTLTGWHENGDRHQRWENQPVSNLVDEGGVDRLCEGLLRGAGADGGGAGGVRAAGEVRESGLAVRQRSL